MDTVSMLNKMSFYCQPILPLVYDESMSYYETLCKVVGQLNTTGDAVNKLNEGLTGEIADRHAADAALDERLKLIEDTNKKIHFLMFAGTPPHKARPILAMPTRDELRKWVDEGHMIITLLQTTNDFKESVYAMSCSYNADNWTNTSEGFNLIVPVSTTYDAEKDYAIRQRIAKITIPPESADSLNELWGLQFIDINTPSTSANGVVNIAANISESGTINCNLTPFDFKELYAPAWANKNLCVAVNAKLFYDGYTRTSSTATIDSTNHRIRIAFERDYGTHTKNGVKQLNKTFDYLIGDVSQNTWTHESIDSRTLDLKRYEGFQFTRGAGNVITTDDESTPNAIYAQYHSDTSGKLYQNLPVRLIDTVDNAEYWNGVFDIKDNKHMTFTFSAAKYDTISDEMHVNIIELSADVNTTAWKYSAKVIDLPYRPTSYTLDVWLANETPTISNGVAMYEGNSSLDYDTIRELVDGSKDIVAMLHHGTSETSPEWSSLVYSSKQVVSGTEVIAFAATSAIGFDNGIPAMNCAVSFSKDTSGATKVQIVFASALPVPSADGSDNGKVPAINGTAWGLKTLPPSATVDTAMSDTSTKAVQNKVIKKYVDDAVSLASEKYLVESTAVSEGEYDAARKQTDYYLTFNKTNNEIIAALNSGKDIQFKITLTEGNKTYPVYFNVGYTRVDVFANVPTYMFIGSFGVLDHSVITVYGVTDSDETFRPFLTTTGGILPEPNPDDSDDGKVLTVNKHKWELKALPNAATVDTAMSDTSTNAVQNKVIKKYVDDGLSKKAPSGDYVTNAELNAKGYLTLDTLPKYGGETA